MHIVVLLCTSSAALWAVLGDSSQQRHGWKEPTGFLSMTPMRLLSIEASKALDTMYRHDVPNDDKPGSLRQDPLSTDKHDDGHMVATPFYKKNPKTSTKFDGWKDTYLGSDTAYGEVLHTLYTLMGHNYTHVDHFVSVVGSFTALHLLTVLRPKEITFFDMNPQAIQWAHMQLELLYMSDTPQKFASRLFSRDVDAFERTRGEKLSPHNQLEFMSQPISHDIRDDTRRRLSEESLQAYKEVMEQFQDGKKHHVGRWRTNSLVPCQERCLMWEHASSRLGAVPFSRVDGVSSFLYGEGFLSNQWTFGRVKSILATVPITFKRVADFPKSDPEDLVKAGGGRGRGMLFTMNMFKGYAHQLTPAKVQAWKNHIGKDGLVLLQTTMRREQLVMEFDPKSAEAGTTGHWFSRSDWNSAQFLPFHLCLENHPDECRSKDSQTTPGVRDMLKALTGRDTALQIPEDEAMAFSILSQHNSIEGLSSERSRHCKQVRNSFHNWFEES